MKAGENHLRKQVVKAISDYFMLAPGDRVMVAVSGGKDSAVMLYLLREVLKKWAVKDVSLHPVILDQNQPGFRIDEFKAWVQYIGFELTVLDEDTYSVVKEKTKPGKSYCGLCSRLRRGILYSFAYVMGYTKIALGHHRDDCIQTLMLNLFYGGTVASMPPKLRSDDGRNTVIRPLCYLHESDIEDLSRFLSVPTIPCNLCSNQENLQRQQIKQWLKEFDSKSSIQESIFAAIGNIKPTQLMDKKLQDFNW